MNALIVADNPVERELLEEQVYLLGHTVTVCATAKIALKHYQQMIYPLVIVDLNLPDMDALEFCRRIRSFQQEEHSLILVIASIDKLEKIQAAIEAGVDDYLNKPLDKRLLKLRLTMLDRQIKHKQALEVLRKSQTYAGNIIESSLDMIIAVDMERRIVEFNKAAQKTFGYRAEEVLGKHVTMLYANENEASIIARIITKQGRCVHEILNRRKNGEIFPCLLSASILLDAQGNPVGFMGISRDITERKRAEEALKKAHAELEQQNVELARASKLKDEFLSTMSHELRTPLTIILGQSELLQERMYGTLNNRQLEALESIGKSSHHLLKLIDDILDFSKISQRKLKLEIASVFIEKLCQDSLQSIVQLAHEKQLEISSMVDRNVTVIQADERRLRQALSNLLDNAVKFTPEGGKIGLEVQGDARQRVVHFTIWDTGIGISEEDREQLFQPFVQLDSGLSRKYRGIGLGLSIAFHIVNMHSGTISVKSEMGKGSRFTVSLPWEDENSPNIHN